VDVNIYAVGSPAREKLTGNHENTEIGKFIKEYLELDLDSVTRLLNSGYGLSFIALMNRGPPLEDEEEHLGMFQEQGDVGRRYH
jgi:hypothetical protein